MAFPIHPTLALCSILVIAGCRKGQPDSASDTADSIPSSVGTAALCTVRGTVRRHDRTPVFGAIVEMYDSHVPDETREALCASAGDSICRSQEQAEEDGQFSVTAAVTDDFHLDAIGGVREITPETTEIGLAGRIFSSCPTAPVVLTLDSTYTVDVFMVRVQENAISWKPAEHGITRLRVTSRAGLKWEIQSAAGKAMRSPIVYGMVPPGAAQVHPGRATPAALVPGDVVSVTADGSSIEDVPHTGSGDVEILDRGPSIGPMEKVAGFTGWVSQVYARIIGVHGPGR